MPYTPQTPDDIQEMLSTIGVSQVDDLFNELPAALLNPEIELPTPLAEQEIREEMARLGDKNRTLDFYLSFIGGGAYDRIRPSLIDTITSRAEFATSYTPYQAEVSQGTLQFIFEFQSMIAALTGLEAANASMYDGASALAEAALMAMRITRKNKVLYAATIHPRWKETIRTYLEGIETELVEVPERDGILDSRFLHDHLDDQTAAFLVQQPNFWGFLEDVSAWREAIGNARALWVQASDPVSLGVVSPPGTLGADIAVGELQSLGLPLSFGGPYAGYFACKQKYVRQIPGRVVGKTTDLEGKTGYVLTLQTREQHIRRDKATSNICTNQSLCALGATLYLSLMGATGMREVARQNHDKAHYLAERMAAVPGVNLISSRPFFNEFTLQLPLPASEVAKKMKNAGILVGIHQAIWTGSEDRLVVCATETKKKQDLDRMADVFAQTIQG